MGVIRTWPRMVRHAARIETPFLRVFDARYGYMLKYNVPAPNGPMAPASVTKSPSKQVNPDA